MLVITVEFLHGTYRADPDGLAATGRLREGEWPPSPLRLLAALVAADGTDVTVAGVPERRRGTDGTELELLERADPPVIYAAPLARVRHERLLPRFVVEHKGRAAKGFAHQEYQGRKGVQVRPGVRAVPADPRVVFAWHLEAPVDVVERLAYRAARIGYLGCADSPVRVTVSTSLPEELADAYTPDSAGGQLVGVPREGVIAAMDAHHAAWVRDGASVQRAQFPALRRQARYLGPEDAEDDSGTAPFVFWLRLERAISGRRVSAVTEAFKAAVLSLFDDHIAEPPPELTGHGFVGTGYQPAWYLALPDVGWRHSRGRIHGLALRLPATVGQPLLDQCRAVLGRLDTLRGHGFSPVNCALYGGEPTPRAANPARWQPKGGHRHWVTAFPAVYERRVEQLGAEEIGRWCEHADLPLPAAARTSRVPLLPGGVSLAPVEAHRPGRGGKPYCHVELWFEEPVNGPVVIGGARQRGLGLCAPVGPEGRDGA